MKFWIPIFLGLFISNSALAGPDIFSISIGGKFPEKSPFENDGSKNYRPTLQFRVPNSGESERLFPEYEVAILRSTNEISIITAVRVFTSMVECQEKKDIAEKWVKKVIPNATLSLKTRIYGSEFGNVFATLDCLYSNDSPYPNLELQFRGKLQDKKLEEAWRPYFQKQH